MVHVFIKIAFAAVWALVDSTSATLLYIHGNQLETFQLDLSNFYFTSSLLDFVLLAYIRTSFLLGGVFGIIRNPFDGPRRCKATLPIASCFLCVIGYYSCIKLLAFSETDGFFDAINLHWFLALFIWTVLAILICYASWRVLAGCKNVPSGLLQEKGTEPEKESLLKPNALKNGNYSTINEVSNAASHSTTIDNSSINGYYDPSASFSNDSSLGEVTSEKLKVEKDDQKGYGELLNKVTLGTMLSYSLPDWPFISCAIVFLTISSIAQIFLPLYTGKVVSAIVVEGSDSFTKNIVIMGLISLTASLFGGLRGGMFMIVIQKLNIRVRNALFGSITSQEIGFFDRMKTGDITSRLTSDTTTMSDTVGLNCNIFIRNIIQAIGICVFMFALSWRMSLLTLMGLPLVFALSELYGKYYKKLQKQVQDRFAVANAVADEVCSSMQTVRSFANEKEEKERYNLKLLDVYQVMKKQCVCYAGYVWTTQTIELMLTVATLWYGGHLLVGKNLTAENFISFILYQQTLGECFSEIGEVYTGLMQALGAAEKVFELIKRKPVISTEDGTNRPDTLEGRISFRNVSFSYPTRPDQPVLKDVSFDVEPGEVVALVGPSGGGKSSCVKLLQRFYEPSSGSVLIDGKSVSSYQHEFLHEKVSLVGQEPVLYARSVSSNILYGLDEYLYTHDDVIKAATMANAHSFIMELPQKYETETGEKGTQLSGGQKQRVAIARAMVRNPSLLLLDEATSALDTESEFLVQEALERSKSDRTVLLVAHRLSTVERADKIVVIVKGSVVEVGSHQELMEKRGTYYKLVYRQLHRAEEKDKQETNHIAPDALLIPSTLRQRNDNNDLLSTSSCSPSSVGSLKITI